MSSIQSALTPFADGALVASGKDFMLEAIDVLKGVRLLDLINFNCELMYCSSGARI